MTSRADSRDLICVPLVIVGLAATSSVTFAQETETLEEVIVTAAKREGNLQDTPVSIAALTGETLGSFNVQSAEDMISAVVGLEGTITAGNLALAIRGVNSENTDLTSDPTVAFHVDGVFRGRQTGGLAVFHDLERVETLRGPQGTLYGRNATAGSINVITAKPKQDLEGNVEVITGNYNRRGFSGVFNAPVIKDKVAIRLAVLKDERDGYFDNGPLIANPYGDSDEFAARFHALITPNDRTSLLLTADYQERGGVGDGTNVLIGPAANMSTDLPNPYTLFQNTEGTRDDEFLTLKGELNYSFETVDLTYIGAYFRSDVNFGLDYDRTVLYPDTLDIRNGSSQWSHEMRLSSSGHGPLEWLVGLYYFDEDASRHVRVAIPRFANRVSLTDTPDYFVKSKSIFGQATYSLSDTLRITAGLRYTDDEKSQGDTVYTSSNNSGTTVVAVTNSGSWSSTDWTAGVDWHPVENTMLYAKVGTGFKAGAFNVANPAFSVAESTFRPEEILAFQVGHKSIFNNDRLQINSEAFYYDYTDLQVTQRLDTTTITRNAASADIYGFETEITALPIDKLQVSLAVGYLDAAYGEFVQFNPFTNVENDLSGETMVKAPKWSVNAGVAYTFNVGSGWQLVPRIRTSYRSDMKLLPFDDPGSLQESRTVTDASVDLVSRNAHYRARLFVNNIEDKVTWSSAGTSGVGMRVLTGRPPRFYGASLTVAFGQ